ncbi:MAG: DUF3299 domain-containing protein [Cyanobacteria bacterium P01_A01_bin.116]
MDFFSRRSSYGRALPSRRYAAYLWACLLSCAFVLGPIFPASAQTTVTWEDLQTQSNHLRNPYEHLTTTQTYQLSGLYQLREWIKVNQPAPESFERKELQRLEDLFEAEGIDADELLKDADEARAYWSAQSRGTNADITESPILIDGYVLPLGTEASQGRAQKKLINEFLLVPYVGACIHVPAPPPNQMVYVKTSKDVENPGIFSPVQVEGELQAYEGSYELFQLDGSRTVDVSYKMTLNAMTPTANQPVAPSLTGNGGGSLLTLQGWKQLPRAISSTLTTALNRIQNQKSPQAIIFALLLSFSYGVLHTLGPGHGKAVIVSYFVGQGGSLQRGLLMGGQIAIFHVLSATLLVIATDTVVRQIGGTAETNYRVVQLLSYGAIALLGGWMLRQTLAQKTLAQKTKHQIATPVAALSSDKALSDLLYPSLSQQIRASTQPENRQSTNRLVTSQKDDRDGWISCSCLACGEANSMSGWLALAVGAVPCSGALLVLLYGLANDMLWQSVAMVLAISTGMAMTLAWIGIMAILTHRWGAQMMQQRLEKQQRLGNKKAIALPIPLAQLGRIIGASCVCLLGISLFAATWMTGA